MNHTLRQLRRLRAGDVIVAGDVELVQQIEMTVDPGKRPTRQQTEEARRLLQAGKGWKFLPVEAWLVGKKVKETAHGLCAARSVWRKRVTGPNRGKGEKMQITEKTVMARVCWRWIVPLPDHVNCGVGLPMAREEAAVWVNYGNLHFPHIKHWIEEEED